MGFRHEAKSERFSKENNVSPKERHTYLSKGKGHELSLKEEKAY